MTTTKMTDRIIVMQGNQYFVGDALGRRPMYRFSPHAYDARGFDNTTEAYLTARKVGGTVRHFNAMHGELIDDA